MSLRAFQEWSAFVFDVSFGYPFQRAIRTARETGIGISAPNAHRLRDVIRHDFAMVVGFICLVTLISRVLYIVISPQDIFDMSYVLAILYMFYSIAVIVLIYQAVRDSKYPSSIDMDHPERFPPLEQCPICLIDAPKEELISLQCFTPEQEEAHPERILHSFHESCLMQSYAGQRQNGFGEPRCPLCRQIPLGYRRNYGPPEHGVLDNSRLMWYINSFFSRRLPLTIFTWRGRAPLPSTHNPEVTMEMHYLQLLVKVLPMHMFFTTHLIMLIRFLYFSLFLPLSWPAWVVVVVYIILFLRIIAASAIVQQIDILLLPRTLTIGVVLNNLSNVFSYLFPAYTGANPENFDFPVRQFIQRQFSTLLLYFRILIWNTGFKFLYYIFRYAAPLVLIWAFLFPVYHLVALSYTGPF
ncbi:hypothetical protein F5Y12DRAFT_799663 [Xylaria sp. FL1777]|nr:hypothetical protein F5Y12DRAFT_799663 [Xylaria sp. FL1777]